MKRSQAYRIVARAAEVIALHADGTMTPMARDTILARIRACPRRTALPFVAVRLDARRAALVARGTAIPPTATATDAPMRAPTATRAAPTATQTIIPGLERKPMRVDMPRAWEDDAPWSGAGPDFPREGAGPRYSGTYARKDVRIGDADAHEYRPLARTQGPGETLVIRSRKPIAREVYPACPADAPTAIRDMHAAIRADTTLVWSVRCALARKLVRP